MPYLTKGAILVVCLTLLGCSGSEDDELRRYMREVKARKTRPIEPIPEFQPLPVYIFPEQDNRRNPFRPRVAEQPQSAQYMPDLQRKKESLEFFPLDSLKFVGTLKEGNKTWALVLQSEGTISHVRVGNYMGQNYGKIIQIKDTSITLEEMVQVNGKWVKKITTINLQKRD